MLSGLPLNVKDKKQKEGAEGKGIKEAERAE